MSAAARSAKEGVRVDVRGSDGLLEVRELDEVTRVVNSGLGLRGWRFGHDHSI